MATSQAEATTAPIVRLTARIVLWVLAAAAVAIAALTVVSAILVGFHDDHIALAVAVIAGGLALGALFGWAGYAIKPHKTRPCPRCAVGVRQGLVVCPNCGFDFGTLVPPSAQPPEGSR